MHCLAAASRGLLILCQQAGVYTHPAVIHLQITLTCTATPRWCYSGQTDEVNVPDSSLAGALDAQQVQQELQSAAGQIAAQQAEHADSDNVDSQLSSTVRWCEGLCGLSLLPLDALQMPLARLQSGQPCLVSQRSTSTLTLPTSTH